MPNEYIHQVPQSIYFSDQVLTIPTFLDLGLEPNLFTIQLRVTNYIRTGNWVNRGDRLMVVTTSFFSTPRSPRWRWLDASPSPMDFYLESPCAGFVISLNRCNCSSWNFPPILLIPRDEPPISHSVLNDFCSSIGRRTSEEWERLAIMRDAGPHRASEVTGKDQAIVARSVESLSKWRLSTQLRFPVSNVTSHRDKDTLIRDIQWFRSQDLVLRDKLVHLVKD
jgi:hypothetical protein